MWRRGKGRGSTSRLSDRRQREKENLRRLPRAISAAILFEGRRERQLNDSRCSDDRSDNNDNRERPSGIVEGKSKSKINPVLANGKR